MLPRARRTLRARHRGRRQKARARAPEWATENAVALANLRELGLRTDGSKALAKAVSDVFGHFALIQGARSTRGATFLEQLPENKRGSVCKAMYDAYRSRSADTARRLLKNLERTLRKNHPGAAASLREGLEETFTVLELRRHGGR